MKADSRERLLRALWIGAACTVLAALSASQNGAYRAYAGQPVPWLSLLVYSLVDWYGLAVFAPLIFWLVDAYSISRDRWVRRGALHLVSSVAMVVAKICLTVPLFRVIFPESSYSVTRMLAGAFFPQLGPLWGAIGVAHAVQYYRGLRQREIRAAQLEAELGRAQLDLLRVQLQPHFLFNTLHAISTLMHRDVNAANEMLTELADLLRQTLASTSQQKVTLKQELDVVRSYLRIMQIRFGDRLQIDYAIAPETLDAQVPSFILQPLVENAIQHGTSKASTVGKVGIESCRENGKLCLVVRDNGPGETDPENRRTDSGVGLTNTRSRLRHLYGEDHRLDLANLPRGGFEVTLRLPFLVQPVTEGSA